METTVSYLLVLQKYMKSKPNNSEIKYYALCLSNISKEYKINNMKKQD